ncbi:MAG: homoserine dehydrogenase [Lachnospiraceae bacterium]|nr:homoserine dehydrogenase [Lachnospiraceae bacterium]
MKAAILGYGTVGSGVYEILTKNEAVIAAKAGEAVEVKYVLDLRDFPGDPVEKVLVHDYEIIAADPEIAIVIEVMGGVKPAYEFVKRALLAGKNVCTSNKELVAKHGAELLAIAKEQKVNFYFEASVGGGIPIIRPLQECLTADVYEEISGILNGTTNYILTRMYNEGADFDGVLKEAQACGYAERNPAADIEGHDAGRKIAILASLAEGKKVAFEDVTVEGITAISSTDIQYAKALGAKIKLIASAKWENGSLFMMVAPKLITAANPLYSIDDVVNAVKVRGNMLGDVMFSGRGAGKLPTASAVVSDVVAAAKHAKENTGFFWSEEVRRPESTDTMVNRFLVRVDADKKAKAEAVFGAGKEVSIGLADEFAFVTEPMQESVFAAKAAELGELRGRIRAELV